MAHGEARPIWVIKAVVEAGLTRNEAARIFQVGSGSRAGSLGDGSRKRAAQQFCRPGAERRSALKRHWDWLLDDLTLDAIAERLPRAQQA
ncbi:transposase [Bradyrhizobium sp. LB7.1]